MLTYDRVQSRSRMIKGYKLVGKRDLEIAISSSDIILSSTRGKFGFDLNLKRIRQIQEKLIAANEKLGTSVALGHLFNIQHLFGASPKVISSLATPEAREVAVEIAKEMYVPVRTMTKVKKPKILLYTAQGGGGHMAQTKSIQGYLESLGIETKILAHDALGFDPVEYLTAGKFKEQCLFNRIMQKKIGIDGRSLSSEEIIPEVIKYAKMLDAISNLTGKLNRYQTLHKELENPNYIAMIDSFPYPSGAEGSAIALGVPYIRWATDFDTWEGLIRSFDFMDASRGKLALTSGDLIANRRLQKKFRDSDLINNVSELPYFIKKRSSKIESDESIKVTLEDPRVFVAGYPIRSEIKKLSRIDRRDARLNINVTNEDILISVMMGSQGKAELTDIVKKLLMNPPGNNIGNTVVVIAVGSNFPIKDEIAEILDSNNVPQFLKFKYADEVFGVKGKYINAFQMNQLLNGSDLLISKPGGSTTAEILETETPIYMFGLNDGEKENASYLIRSGLGALHNESKAMGIAVQEIIDGDVLLSLNPSFKLPEWRKSIKSMLTSMGIPTKFFIQK